MTTTTREILTFTARPEGTVQWVWDRKIVFATVADALQAAHDSRFATEPCEGLWAEVFAHPEGYSIRHMMGDRVSSYLCHG